MNDELLKKLAEAVSNHTHQCPEAESIMGQPHGPHLWVPTFPAVGTWAAVWFCKGLK